MNPYILSENDEGVLLFTINRVNRRNAIDFHVMEGLELAIEKAGDKTVKMLAITGAGDKAFCSGGDLQAFHELKTEEQAKKMLTRMSAILYKLLVLPKPTVAILNGSAVGGGCEIAAACDFRIGKPHIKAGFIQANLAITTGWGGGTILLEKLGQSTAMKMLMDGNVFTAEELIRNGFLDYLFEGDSTEGCLEYFKDTLNQEVDVLEAYKLLVNQKWDLLSMEKRMSNESKRCAVLWGKETHHLKVQEFLDRGKK